MKIINKKKGFTLIELIISMALLSILLIIFADLFMFSVNLLGKSSKGKIGNMNAASKIELFTAGSSSDVTPTSGSFNIKFGSSSVNVNGNYIPATDSGSRVNYKSFIPNDIP
ncbi:type II secretion system protein [Clostridium estertheticum]|uniref:type II secretion system protein n=1 Tax=Clostridium estertheticum TaxID=238834 RepID=UPI001CF411A6|nr:type II secretion system protein [Clostridium estertheticum]MCB2359927.1 type II secretion system GspH family protein [Clostridium estertheticum]